MKRNRLFVLLIVIILVFTACSKEGTALRTFRNSDDKIADSTCKKIISAVSAKDETLIVDMFSGTIRSNMDLNQAALALVSFVRGEIVSFSSASEAGVGSDCEVEMGKQRKVIQSAFHIITTEKTYYIAVKECVKDEFDSNNVGILSIYIIEADNWTEDYIYRGDGKWTYGINIVVS